VRGSPPILTLLVCMLPSVSSLPLDLLQRVSLGLGADMRVPRQYLPRDMARDFHDGLIARAILGQFGDPRMPVVGDTIFLSTRSSPAVGT